MRALHVLFSPSGRLRQQTFAIAVLFVYAAGAASHLLTTPDVIARVGLWPFVAAQALLIWIWFALHAKRLRDAGRPVGLAAGICLLYVLSIVLLIFVAAAFFSTSGGEIADPNAASALGLLLLASIIAVLLGSPHYDVSWLIVTILVVMAIVPLVVAVVFSLWAGMQKSGVERAA